MDRDVGHMPRMSNRCPLGLCDGSGQLRVARRAPASLRILSSGDLRDQYEYWQRGAVLQVDVVDCRCLLSDQDVVMLSGLGIRL